MTMTRVPLRHRYPTTGLPLVPTHQADDREKAPLHTEPLGTGIPPNMTASGESIPSFKGISSGLGPPDIPPFIPMSSQSAFYPIQHHGAVLSQPSLNNRVVYPQQVVGVGYHRGVLTAYTQQRGSFCQALISHNGPEIPPHAALAFSTAQGGGGYGTSLHVGQPARHGFYGGIALPASQYAVPFPLGLSNRQDMVGNTELPLHGVQRSQLRMMSAPSQLTASAPHELTLTSSEIHGGSVLPDLSTSSLHNQQPLYGAVGGVGMARP
jgi:hypothetical protein